MMLAGIGMINAVLFAIGTITRTHSIVLFLIYLISIVFIWREESKSNKRRQKKEKKGDIYLVVKNGSHFAARFLRVLKLLASLFLVFGSSALTVHFAVDFAVLCNLSLHSVGATIVAIGTALPELALCLSALRKKESGLILGPMLGNIMGHGTLIMGVLTLCSPQPIDLRPMLGTAFFIFAAFSIIGYGLVVKRIQRGMGFVLVSLFGVYLTYHFFL